MSDTTRLEADDVQRLENLLGDTATPAVTRRALVTRAAAGAAGIGVLGALEPIPAALAAGNSINDIVTDAVTA